MLLIHCAYHSTSKFHDYCQFSVRNAIKYQFCMFGLPSCNSILHFADSASAELVTKLRLTIGLDLFCKQSSSVSCRRRQMQSEQNVEDYVTRLLWKSEHMSVIERHLL